MGVREADEHARERSPGAKYCAFRRSLERSMLMVRRRLSSIATPVSDKGEKKMINDMMGAGMWGMGLVWLLVLVFLILAIAALIKYIRR